MSMTRAEAFEIFRYYASKEFEDIPKNDSEIDYEFSDEFKRKMDRLLKKISYGQQRDVTPALRKALIAAAVLIITVVGILSISAIRRPAVEFVQEIYREFKEIISYQKEQLKLPEPVVTTTAKSPETGKYHEQISVESYEDKFITPTEQDMEVSTEKSSKLNSSDGNYTKPTAPPKTTAGYTVDSSLFANRISYRKKGNMYYVNDRDVAEREKGYSSEYSSVVVTASEASLKKIVVDFTYGGTDWRITSTKGVYGYRLAGSETFVYTISSETGFTEGEEIYLNRYYIPDEDNWLNIQTEAFDVNNNPLFLTDYEKHWWANGYVESDIESHEEITAKNRIKLKDEEMTNLFTQGLNENGLTQVMSENELAVNCYYVNGNEVIYIF